MSDGASTGLGSGTDGASTTDDSSSSGNDTGEVFDVGDGAGSAGDGDGDKGCRGIDFLFVVDNSGSMKDEQENLTASFPGFVQAIEEKVAELDAADFHILVTDTDEVRIRPPGPYCSLECDGQNTTCTADGGDGDVPCEFYEDQGCLQTCQADLSAHCAGGAACTELLGCEECGCGRGEGIIDDLQGSPCGIQGGQRYIQSGQPDLAGTFACLAEVGTDGDGDEHQAEGIVRALSPDKVGAGGCNDGFIRDDAILVVTLITDEEDGNEFGEGSVGDPPDWFADVVAAKSGDPDAVVMLGLVGDAGQPNAVCPDDGGATGMYPPRLDELITSFPRHIKGSVCEPNYAGFFEQAVDIIKTTCEVYVPPQG